MTALWRRFQRFRRSENCDFCWFLTVLATLPLAGVIGWLFFDTGLRASPLWKLSHWVGDETTGAAPEGRLQNLLLAAGALVGTPLFIWRICIAGRQAKATRDHARAFVRQNVLQRRAARELDGQATRRLAQEDQIERRRLMASRYEAALTLFGSREPAIALGAVHTLADIAGLAPEYRKAVVDTLATWLRQYRSVDAVRSARAQKRADAAETSESAIEDSASSHGEDEPFDAAVSLGEVIVDALRSLRPRDAADGGSSAGRPAGTGRAHGDHETAAAAAARPHRIDLRSVWLLEADLAGAWLPRVDLRGALLTEANLSQATLCRGRLDGAKLPRAMLSGADLSESRLDGARFTDASLHGANLGGAWIEEGRPAYFKGARFNGATLCGAVLPGCQFAEADFNGATLAGALLIKARFNEATLDGAKLTDADMTRARLDNASLKGADLTGACLRFARLSGADLTGVQGLDAAMLEEAYGNEETTLPDGVPAPDHWSND